MHRYLSVKHLKYVDAFQNVFISVHFPVMKSLWLSQKLRGAFPKCQTLRHFGYSEQFGGLLECLKGKDPPQKSQHFSMFRWYLFEIKILQHLWSLMTSHAQVWRILQETTWWTLRVDGEIGVARRIWEPTNACRHQWFQVLTLLVYVVFFWKPQGQIRGVGLESDGVVFLSFKVPKGVQKASHVSLIWFRHFFWNVLK